MNKKTKTILRWVAVLPGALLAGFLATFPVHWVLYFSLAHGETISGVNINPIEYTIYPFFVALAFVLAGFAIAPKYKFKTSIVLTCLWIISFFSAFIIAPMVIPQIQLKFELRGILSILGSLLGLYIAWLKSKELTTASIIS